MSVNVASQDLEKPDFVAFIESVLTEVVLPADKLKLEITERSLIENDEKAATVLTELHDRGVKLALDDFGTGYSSLSYLHRFPFDDLKIDQSFIKDMETEKRQAAQVKAIIQLAHNLDLSVTAEGVESAASMAYLKNLNCECVQGYYLSQPIYPEELGPLLESEPKL
jgi:EAL domain-containing protein (putative c-di-GMP-specific phosphodiesterase class I)